MAEPLAILTDHRNRLRPGVSYPIGAEVVSDVFGNLVPSRRFELLFISPTTWDHLNSETIQQHTNPYLTLHVSIRRQRITPGATDSINSNGRDKIWQLTVYSVPSKHKSKVKLSLLDTALPIAYKWIACERPETWAEAGHSLRLFFDPKLQTISSIES